MLGNGSDDLNKYMATCKRVSWRSERKFEYLEWAKNVVDEIAGTHEVLENLFYDEHRWGRLKI